MTNNLENVFLAAKSMLAISIVWLTDPIILFLSSKNIGIVSEFLIASKDFINVFTSIVVLLITILRFKKEKKKE